MSTTIERFKIIHHKEPRELIRPPRGRRWKWPRKWALSGHIMRTYYASDRGRADGDFEHYYHDHRRGIVHLWEPAGARKWGMPGVPEVALEEQLVCLGSALGFDIERTDGQPAFVECAETDLLAVNAAGTILVWIDPKIGPYALAEGRGMIVGPYGIEG